MTVKAKGRVTFVKNIPGDAAISVDMTPRQVVLNTNNSGLVEDFSGAVATVTAYKGSEPTAPANITIRRVQNCVARVDLTTRTVKITQVSQNGDTGYSHEYGSVDIDVRVGTQTFTQKLTFVVNIHKVVASMKVEQDSIISKVEEIGNRKYGGVNLLRGTRFDVLPPPLSGTGQPAAFNNNVSLGTDVSKRHLGRNYVRIEEQGLQDPNFDGLFYIVDAEPGGVYTASVWIMSDNVTSIDHAGFAIEVLKMRNGERVPVNASIGYEYSKPKVNGVWERVVYTFTVPSDINQVGVNFWLTRNGRIHVSEPQLEHGDVATDWSDNPDDIRNDLSQTVSAITQKSDEIELMVKGRKIGGRNLLYDTSFKDAGTTIVKDGMRVRHITREFSITKENSLDGDNSLKYNISGSTGNTFAGVFYEVKAIPGEEYTISVYTRSDDINTIDNQCWLELYVKKQGYQGVYAWGLNIKPTESGKWQRFVRTFTVQEGDYDSVAVNIFLTRNGKVQFAHPQLERGNVATDWSDNPSDMMDSLESAGIKIRKDSIILRGKNVAIEDEDGETETLFLGGKMRGKFIDIEQMLVGEVDARHAIINNLTVTGFVRQRAFHVTQENFYNVTIPKEYKGKISYEVDFTKTGAFIVFDFLPANRTCVIFPSITYNYGRYLSKADIPRMIPFLEQSGQRVFVINNAGTNELHLAGCFNGYGMSIDVDDSNAWNNRNNEYAYYKDRYLLVGSVAGLECTWRATGNGANGPGDICVYWDFTLCLPG